MLGVSFCVTKSKSPNSLKPNQWYVVHRVQHNNTTHWPCLLFPRTLSAHDSVTRITATALGETPLDVIHSPFRVRQLCSM